MRKLAGAAVVIAVVGSVLSAPVTQAAPPKPLEGGTVYSVTLVTGDRVTVVRTKNTWEIQDIDPAARTDRRGGFVHHAGPDGVTVIPRDVVGLLRDGRLDDAFFDVDGLIRQGFDDAHTNEVPLLVQSDNRRTVTTLGQVTRELPEARLTAVSAPKSSAVLDTLRTSGAKIWLNGRAFPTLDQSVRQVGAPEAWAGGHTGAGATVAVLDSGYDPDHPDLAGIITSAQDFVASPSGVRDQDGHGTHVASTVAGRGTASGGKYVGVAKDANLMVGKVCDPMGCPYDAIIAGMQWAAESGARVVNMSLGGGSGDGTDPLETELNRLSAEHGTLFVVAAGNYAEYGVPVTSPATADAALAVASVNKQDQLSVFSSRGPRTGDLALKPDIAAPGEDIVAARAAGTLPDKAVDDHHARLSGTSMATPHVAGAAAILAAQHPDWTGAQLKAALMSSAQPIDAGVYEAGTGRLDIARAVRQPVTANPASLNLGYVRWPHNTTPEPKTVTYHNTATTDRTLDLALTAWHENGQPAPDGMFRADRSSVTVPAGGSATVTVMFDLSAGPVGTYGGRLTATDGDTVVQTTIGGHKEPERYELTVRLTDRDGRAIPDDDLAGYGMVVNLDSGDQYFPIFSDEPLRLPPGRYTFLGTVSTPVQGTPLPSETLVAAPEVVLDRDTVVSLDARKATKVGVQVDREGAALVGGVSAVMVRTDTARGGTFVPLAGDVYVLPTTGHTDGFAYYTRAGLEEPPARLTVDALESFEVTVRWGPGSPRPSGARTFTTVDVGRATSAEIAAHDLTGKLAVFTLGAGEGTEFDARVRALAAAGAAAVLQHFTGDPPYETGEQQPIPVLYTVFPEGGRLAALGTASVILTGTDASPYRYELAFPHLGGLPSSADHRARDSELATVRAKYGAMVSGGVGYVDQRVTGYGINMTGGSYSSTVRLPAERTEYYTAAPVSWRTTLRAYPTPDAGPAHSYLGPWVTGQAGSVRDTAWHTAVVGPALAVADDTFVPRQYSAAREGDTISAALPLLSDAGGHSGLPAPEDWSFADTGETSLYANGSLVDSSGSPGYGEFAVQSGAADYRLVSSVTRNHPSWPLSTKVSAEWAFRSAHADVVTALPLLTVGFAPKVDALNHAAASQKITIPVTVNRQTGAEGSRPKLDRVEYSLDDGTTWIQAKPRKKGDRWEVTIPNPANGFVSLRAAASDHDGNTVKETIIRAYRVR